MILQFSTILMPRAVLHALLRKARQRRRGLRTMRYLVGQPRLEPQCLCSRSALGGFPSKDTAFCLFRFWANPRSLYFHLVKLVLKKLFFFFLSSLRSSGSLSLIRSSQLFAGTVTVASSLCSLSNPSPNPFSCFGKLTLLLWSPLMYAMFWSKEFLYLMQISTHSSQTWMCRSNPPDLHRVTLGPWDISPASKEGRDDWWGIFWLLYFTLRLC